MLVLVISTGVPRVLPAGDAVVQLVVARFTFAGKVTVTPAGGLELRLKRTIMDVVVSAF